MQAVGVGLVALVLLTVVEFFGFSRRDTSEGRYTAIATGHRHSCAIRTDQTIACWSNNRERQADAPEGRS